MNTTDLVMIWAVILAQIRFEHQSVIIVTSRFSFVILCSDFKMSGITNSNVPVAGNCYKWRCVLAWIRFMHSCDSFLRFCTYRWQCGAVALSANGVIYLVQSKMSGKRVVVHLGIDSLTL